jgi:hypothetical protein
LPLSAVLIQTDEGASASSLKRKRHNSVADLRDSEAAKIACGKAHFSALRIKEQSPEYVVATNLATVLAAANE